MDGRRTVHYDNSSLEPSAPVSYKKQKQLYMTFVCKFSWIYRPLKSQANPYELAGLAGIGKS